MNTIQLWQGPFGNTYHDRNRFTPEDVKPLYDQILGSNDIVIRSVLEVGSGLGHNLQAIQATERVGVEPNAAARDYARGAYPDTTFIDGYANHLPFASEYFDLVLTCGLLIHIPPADIHAVIDEITRVTNKYVLAIEYAAAEEEEQEYRGHRDILWRRPYGKLFMAWGGMKLVAWDDADTNLYPGCCWWLLSK